MHPPSSPIPLLIAILNPTPRPMIRNHIPPPPEIKPLTRPPPRPRERRLVSPGAAALLRTLPPGPIDPLLILAPAVDLPDIYIRPAIGQDIEETPPTGPARGVTWPGIFRPDPA
ncbi:hypothetical protein IFM61606_01597 [Aspergillus udagawae]|uniref:Uncharacterized protein n=1 Tax=Aspergillus udagawae TaxID=91492 RepID=A0ABQ1ARS2_9EURO|nr:hypothetical protein IFM51744_02255 [Aspergillus udagawae]GFF86921.1 hypothetical protein IFM53868_04972 [Aspergillus udagawae]GFG03090.1 hypothetical protein IFM5058_01261 [Aspergillus udagawae]GFG21745.1 hypothetical protein IFM61606_01597 [Aspergillus udagawae]